MLISPDKLFVHHFFIQHVLVKSTFILSVLQPTKQNTLQTVERQPHPALNIVVFVLVDVRGTNGYEFVRVDTSELIRGAAMP